jgi:hypothetical protein
MPIDFKVELTIREDFVTEFLELVEMDRDRIHSNAENSAIKSMRLIRNKNNNSFILLQTVTSKKELLQHLLSNEYEWTKLINNPVVISHKYTFCYYIDD